jgi:hypothetical protein
MIALTPNNENWLFLLPSALCHFLPKGQKAKLWLVLLSSFRGRRSQAERLFLVMPRTIGDARQSPVKRILQIELPELPEFQPIALDDKSQPVDSGG